MSAEPARLIKVEERPEPKVNVPVVMPDGQDEFLLELCELAVDQSFARRELRRCLSEINELRRENRWEDIVALFHPVEEKCPELVAAGQAVRVHSEMAFALGFLNRYEKAIDMRVPGRFPCGFCRWLPCRVHFKILRGAS